MYPESTGPGKIMLFEDILNSGLSLRVRVTGKSMLPFLEGGEILTIRRVSPSKLRVGDLIFFRTQAGIMVLHRILRKLQKKDIRFFQTKGDAGLSMDEPVQEHNILGKVCLMERNVADGRTIYMDMESSLWKTSNYLKAVAGLSKLLARNTVSNLGLYKSFRSFIKKSLI